MALVVKTVNLRDLPALVVAADERDVGRVSRLHQEEVSQGLHAVAAPVHEIAHENVALVWDLATNVKQLQQIMELAVNVAANSDRRRYGLNGRFLDEQHFDHVAQLFEIGLGQVLAFLHFFDPRVQIILLRHFGKRVGGAKDVLLLLDAKRLQRSDAAARLLQRCQACACRRLF